MREGRTRLLYSTLGTVQYCTVLVKRGVRRSAGDRRVFRTCSGGEQGKLGVYSTVFKRVGRAVPRGLEGAEGAEGEARGVRNEM